MTKSKEYERLSSSSCLESEIKAKDASSIKIPEMGEIKSLLIYPQSTTSNGQSMAEESQGSACYQ